MMALMNQVNTLSPTEHHGTMQSEVSTLQKDLMSLSSTDRLLRKAAIKKCVAFLQDTSNTSSQIQFSNTLLQICEGVFEAPKTETASSLLAADSKTRSKQLGVVEDSILSAFCLLLSLRSLSNSMTNQLLGSLLDCMWTAIGCNIPELSIKAYDFMSLGFTKEVGKSLDILKIDETLKRLINELEVNKYNDWKLCIAIVEATSSAFISIKSSEAVGLAFQHLPSALHLISSLLIAEQAEVRDKSCSILIDLLRLYCSHEEANLSLESLTMMCQSLDELLTELSVETLNTLTLLMKTLFLCLGRQQAYLAKSILIKLGTAYEASQPVDEIQTESNSTTTPLQITIERLIGDAISCLGVQAVLSSLPLNIIEVMDGRLMTEPRAWLLPLLKRHVRSDSLVFWSKSLYPVIEVIRRRAQELVHKDKTFEFKCQVLEMQIWSLLPAFCQSPFDVSHAYQWLSEMLRLKFVEQEELQDLIALSLSRLWRHSNADQQEVECYRNDGLVWFEILTETFVLKKQRISQNFYEALSSLAEIFETEVFKSISQRLMTRLQDVFVDLSRVHEQGVYLDLVYVLLQAMDASSVHDILKLVELILKSDVGVQCQKKAYKILAYILEHKKSSWSQNLKEMIVLLEETSLTCQQPSLHFRLVCLGQLLSTTIEAENSLLSSTRIVVLFIPEIILGIEGESTKVKDKSKDCLSWLAQLFADRSGFDLLVRSLQPGLISVDNRIITGTIKAVNCLLESHGILFITELPQLLHEILQLTNLKEQPTTSFIVAVVDFVQTLVMILPPSSITPRLPEIMSFLLRSRGPLKKYQQKTKEVLSQLGDKLSFAALDPFVPAECSRVMRNLRSAHLRQLRRNEQLTEVPVEEGFSHTTTKRTAPQSTLTKMMNLSVNDMNEETEDLLNPTESRKLAKAATISATQMGDDDVAEKSEEPKFILPLNEEGKVIISDQTLKKAERKLNRHKKRLTAIGSDSGMTTTTTKKRSKKTESRISRPSQGSKLKSHHSGIRFKAKKGAGGDAKQRSRFEPFAYWRLDRNLLNKRRSKRNTARRDLHKLTRSS